MHLFININYAGNLEYQVVWLMLLQLLKDAHTCLYLFSNSIDLLSLIYFYMRSMIIRLSMSSVRQPMSRLLSSTVIEFDHHHPETRWCWLYNYVASIGRRMAEYFMHIKKRETLPRSAICISNCKMVLNNWGWVRHKEDKKIKHIWIGFWLRQVNTKCNVYINRNKR